MNPQQPNTQDTPAVSGKYRNAHLPEPLHLHSTVYVLSCKTRTWPPEEGDRGGQQNNGILGVYTQLENAQRAGTRWLGDAQPSQPAEGRFDSPRVISFSEWEVKVQGQEWEKARAESGIGGMESRVVRVKRFEVRSDSLVGDGGKGKGRDGGMEV